MEESKNRGFFRVDEPAKAAGVRSRDAIYPLRKDNLGIIFPRSLRVMTPLFRAWPPPRVLFFTEAFARD